ncbi:Imidazole glycerol phosphate synthase amidotransferase subunit [hydrothermal vent metagenome]|uniref:Imidazole glycerol phosphate synthase amidotransferase subunit n=1 Tax=hydrothermal vent metagenome TaxID=652676 RepID=A0A3B0ZND0_9ZZZZ
MKTVTVIDYGMGNLHSVAKALEHVATTEKIIVSGDPQTILKADRVVLPGVGAMRDCMGEIKRLGLHDVIHEVANNKPLFGVCVGMQAMLQSSEENEGVECLGLFKGRVLEFEKNIPELANNPNLKIPHMGWNQVNQCTEHPMWQGVAQNSRFYFVHSYYVEPASSDVIVGTSNYPVMFTSAIANDNIFAVQFHPEKSQHSGLQLYKNFLNWL